MAGRLHAIEIATNEREAQLNAILSEVQILKQGGANVETELNDNLAEKEALMRHCAILTEQNQNLQSELERFVVSDEQFR